MVTQTLEKGYRQTEIGIIPEDWKVQNILDNSTLKARIGWQGLTTAEYLDNGEFYLVTGTDFDNGKIDWDNCVYVDEKRYSQDRNIQLKIEDILVTKDGTIGKIAYIVNLPLPATLNSGIFVVRPKGKAYFPLFLFYVLSSDFFKVFLNKLQAGSTINHLYQKDFVSFNFIIPEYSEQEKIAQTLSDIDDLIESLDKLVTKKKNIKQGAMQTLLTGKKRLPGYGDDWEVEKNQKLTEVGAIPEDWSFERFEDVMTGFTSGQTPSRAKPEYFKGNIPWITSGELNYNIITDTLEKITPEAVRNTNLKIIPEGTFLFAITGLEAEGTRGSCAITGIEATTNQSCMALYPKEGMLTTQYLSHYYVGYGKRLALKYCQGTKQQSYTGAVAKLLPIILPPTVEEQSAIAQVLSDMDAEIEKLEQKRDKYKQLKIGMMQQLLTGRIRLKWKS